MRPSTMLAMIAALLLCGCATGFTPQSDGQSTGAGVSAGYNSDYQGGELSRSPLDRNSEMFR